MHPRTVWKAAALVAAASGLAWTVQAEVRGSRHDADVMKQKMAAIEAVGERPSKQARRTMVTEQEINAYLAYDAADALPRGVANPSVTILGPGRVSASAVVDLDAVRQTSTGMLDPRAYLTGRVPVTASGLLHTANGVGRFELESATVGGVAIPKFLLQQILTFYSRSPEKPSGVSLDEPFALPARIREIQVQRGQAIIVQ